MKQLPSVIKSCASHTIYFVQLYDHGAPGMIGDYRADRLGRILRPKMQRGGQVLLLGCSTGSVDSRWYNVIGGLGIAARAAMYSWQDDGSKFTKWTQSLSKDLSVELPDVFVMGLAGISFPLSRLAGFMEGVAPKGLMAERQWYLNGKKLEYAPKPPTRFADLAHA